MNNWTGIFIFGCWSVLFIYWMIKAANVKRNLEKHISYKYIFLLSVAVIALFATMFYTKTFLQHSLWQTTVRLGVATDIIVGIGLIFAVWSRNILGKNWSSNISYKKGHKLIKHGPYSIVRHPIYTGMIVMLIGTAINVGQVFAFVLLAVYFVGFNARCRLEEELMLKHFAKDYKIYKKRVKAIVPFVF